MPVIRWKASVARMPRATRADGGVVAATKAPAMPAVPAAMAIQLSTRAGRGADQHQGDARVLRGGAQRSEQVLRGHVAGRQHRRDDAGRRHRLGRGPRHPARVSTDFFG